MNLTGKDYFWIQKLDYENVIFCYGTCFDIAYLAKHCPKAS